MMKFNTHEDLYPVKDKWDDDDWDNDIRKFKAGGIPTVDEVDETLSFMYADTVLQILKGQGIYYGYEIERDYDNKIKEFDFAQQEIRIREQYALRRLESEKRAKLKEQVKAESKERARQFKVKAAQEFSLSEKHAMRRLARLTNVTYESVVQMIRNRKREQNV